MNSFISLNQTPMFLSYNEEALSLLFEIIYRGCSRVPDFKESWINNSNFLWSVRHLMIESSSYDRNAAKLTSLLELCLPDSPTLRSELVQRVVEFGFAKIGENFHRIIELTKVSLYGREEKSYFCTLNGIYKLARALTTMLATSPFMKTTLQCIVLALDWIDMNEQTNDEDMEAKHVALEQSLEIVELFNKFEFTDNELLALKEKIISLCP